MKLSRELWQFFEYQIHCTLIFLKKTNLAKWQVTNQNDEINKILLVINSFFYSFTAVGLTCEGSKASIVTSPH